MTNSSMKPVARAEEHTAQMERRSGSPNNYLYRWLEILRCPQCRGHFRVHSHSDRHALVCALCSASYAIQNGIPHLTKPERAPALQNFCEKYDRLRLCEGWACTQPEFYFQLPFQDCTGRHINEWQLRAKSFLQLQAWLKKEYGTRALRVLDAGAGSGWMSRLLAASHEVLATDVNAGAHGLNALAHAQRRFMAVQAELDHLPLTSHSFDLVIANASAHYANDVRVFFAQAARVLRPGGRLIVMDSPIYPNAEAVTAAQERTRAYYTKNGAPELAQTYSGLARELFFKQTAFNFTYLRRDFDGVALFKKWLREKLGREQAARFPLWIGERLLLPEEDWHLGRSRAGVLIVHENKLLTYFFKSEKQQYWRIPGGGIEEGETPEQAAIRELREELGLRIALQRQFGPYLLKNKTHWYFLADTDPEKLPTENSGGFEESCTVSWLPVEHLAEFDIRPSALKWELVEYFQARRSR